MDLRRTTDLSVLLAGLLFLGKVVAWWISDSAAILAEVLNSGIDVLATGIIALGVRLAARPADPDHPYGHGKFENVAGLLEAGLMAGLAVYLVLAGVGHILAPSTITVTPLVLAVLLVALAVDLERTVTLYRALRRTGSPAIRVDLAHFALDGLQMVGVLAGVVAASRGILWADGAAAILVGLLTLVTATIVGWRASAGLTDRVPPSLVARVESAVDRTAGVEQVANVRLREAGQHTFVDTEVGVARSLSALEVHDITADVEAAVRELLPDADIVVHAHPVRTDEATATTVKVVASRDPDVMGVHEVQVLETPNGRYVSCHLEVRDGMTLQQAHDVAQRFEDAVKAQATTVVGIITHIEAQEPPVRGEDVTHEEPELVAGLARACRRAGCAGPAQVVITKDAEGRLHALLHLGLDGGLDLIEAHDRAERVERRALEAMPRLDRVTVHLEPV